jgi:translocation and assembly module TamA
VTRRLLAPVAFLAWLAPRPGFPAEGAHLQVVVEGLGGALSGVMETRSLQGTTLRQNVLSLLSIEQARKEKNLTEARIRSLHKRAAEEIGRALQPFGYYRPAIDARLDRQGADWIARYRIDPGPELLLDSVDVRVAGAGADDPHFTDAVRRFPLSRGDAVNHPAYESGKAAIEEAAAENGYLDAKFETSEIRIDLDRYAATVVLHYQTGPRYLFGPVTFRQDVLKPELLRGYVTWKEGAPLNVNELLNLQNTLSDAPYFSRVEVTPRRDEARGLEVPILVDLIPSKPQRYQFGLGYGTDTGPRASVHADYRRVNRSGHRAELDVRYSGIEKSGSARYLIPGAYPRTDVYTISLGYMRQTTSTSESNTALAGVDRSVSRGRWRESLSLFYQRETFKVGVDRGVSRLLTPGGSWTRVIADDRIDTKNGHRLQFQIQGAAESVLSTATFLQARVTGKWIRSVSDRNRLIGRADVGHTLTSDFRRLPPRVRFFAGGDQSVRGYAFQELGTRDELNNVIGGKTLLVGSVEFEHRFLPKWGGAAFFDAGNATNGFTGQIKKGAGLGVRWISPVGPIRIDGAYGLDERKVRLHVNIGPDL